MRNCFLATGDGSHFQIEQLLDTQVAKLGGIGGEGGETKRERQGSAFARMKALG